MPRPKMFSDGLTKELPRARVTGKMHDIVRWVSQKHEISVSDVVRACIAHTLGLPQENSDLVARMTQDAAREQMLRCQKISSSLENNSEGEK